MSMLPETRDAIGKACHQVFVDRAVPLTVQWDDLPDTLRETWRMAAEAAVATFLELAHLPPPE